MPTPPSTDPAAAIAGALLAVRARIDQAAHAAGRSPQDVTLVAVSKTHPQACVLAALAHDQTCFGENRVQEAAAKFEGLRAAHPGLRLHLIGALQTNKAEDAVRIADVIESLDRPRLADAVETASQRTGRLPDLLVQVNIGDEPQKAGVATDQADAFIETCRKRFGDNLRGLMCIPPDGHDPARFFTTLAHMRARHGLPWLSMGMSGDFEQAVRSGATHIRIGSAIFGHRPASAPTAGVPGNAAPQEAGNAAPRQGGDTAPRQGGDTAQRQGGNAALQQGGDTAPRRGGLHHHSQPL